MSERRVTSSSPGLVGAHRALDRIGRDLRIAIPVDRRPCPRPRPRCTRRGTEGCPRRLQLTPVCSRPELRGIRPSVVRVGAGSRWLTLGPRHAWIPRSNRSLQRPAVRRRQPHDSGPVTPATWCSWSTSLGAGEPELSISCCPAVARTGRRTARWTGGGDAASRHSDGDGADGHDGRHRDAGGPDPSQTRLRRHRAAHPRGPLGSGAPCHPGRPPSRVRVAGTAEGGLMSDRRTPVTPPWP